MVPRRSHDGILLHPQGLPAEQAGSSPGAMHAASAEKCHNAHTPKQEFLT
jgi:hypothetical protein